MDVQERFWSKVIKTEGCWNWTAAKDMSGYGRFGLGGKNLRAQRVAWLLTNGEVPKGLCVCHTCDNRVCVNPKHLWLGTNDDNMKDKAKKGRSHRMPNNRFGAKLSSSIASEIRDMYRTTKMTQVELALKFGVSRGCIGHIVRSETWA